MRKNIYFFDNIWNKLQKREKAHNKKDNQISNNIISEKIDLYGRINSNKSKKPIDADGNPIPWYTYPAIEFFNQINVIDLKIFEYGCGYSTIYWNVRGAKVWSVDHDQLWFNEIKNQLFDQCKGLYLASDKYQYANSIKKCNEKFDIIVIDGVWRNECAIASLSHLKQDGIIILDNSDWYTDVSDFLKSHGFFQVDFNGFGPCNDYSWTTSILINWKSSLTSRLNPPSPIGGIKIDKRGDFW